MTVSFETDLEFPDVMFLLFATKFEGKLILKMKRSSLVWRGTESVLFFELVACGRHMYSWHSTTLDLCAAHPLAINCAPSLKRRAVLPSGSLHEQQGLRHQSVMVLESLSFCGSNGRMFVGLVLLCVLHEYVSSMRIEKQETRIPDSYRQQLRASMTSQGLSKRSLLTTGSANHRSEYNLQYIRPETRGRGGNNWLCASPAEQCFACGHDGATIDFYGYIFRRPPSLQVEGQLRHC